MQNNYTPIDCDLHDELLARATLRRWSEIVYSSEQGEEITIHTRIQDVYSEGHAEYIKFDNGTTIRLDKLIRVDHLRFS